MPSFSHNDPGYGFGGPRYPGTFLLALREALGKLNWQATTWKGGSVECTDPQGISQQIGLENMYRRLKREPRHSWPSLLVDLLSSVPPEAATPPDDLHDVADQLFVRLGPAFSRKDPDLDVWSHPLVEGHLYASLVIDYPNSMSYVTEKMVAASGEDGAHWLERALANLRGKSEAGCVTTVHEETGLMQSQVGDAYDSSRALLLDVLLPGHDQDGFFVIVPGRDHLLVLPVTAETIMMAPWLRAIAGKTHQEMPYPISPELFWVRGGVWHPFAIELDGEHVLVKPPPPFAEVMARLRPKDADENDQAQRDDGGNSDSI
jgi:hypothetical protein